MSSVEDLLPFALALTLAVIALLLSERLRAPEFRRRKEQLARERGRTNTAPSVSGRLHEARLTAKVRPIIDAYNAETKRARRDDHVRAKSRHASTSTLFQTLELVADIVRSCGHQAQVTRVTASAGEVFRLEIRVSDLPQGQPPAYIEFSPDPISSQLRVVYGGVVRGPQVQDGWDAETGWYVVDAEAAEKTIIGFVERVFETHSSWASVT